MSLTFFSFIKASFIQVPSGSSHLWLKFFGGLVLNCSNFAKPRLSVIYSSEGIERLIMAKTAMHQEWAELSNTGFTKVQKDNNTSGKMYAVLFFADFPPILAQNSSEIYTGFNQNVQSRTGKGIDSLPLWLCSFSSKTGFIRTTLSWTHLWIPEHCDLLSAIP